MFCRNGIKKNYQVKLKLIRVTTTPISMNILLRNQLRFLSEYFNVIGVSSRDEKHFEEINKREGVILKEVNLTRRFSPFLDFIALCKLILLFIKEKPQIVHSHTPKAGLISMIAAWVVGIPIRVHTLAGLPLLESKGLNRFLFRISEKITGFCAHRVYPNSYGLKDIVIKMKLYKLEKLKVIGNGSSNGIDLEYYSWTSVISPEVIRESLRKEMDILDSDIVYCFIGRIVKDKGIKELVNAFKRLSDIINISSNNRVFLLMVGPIENVKNHIGEELVNIILTHKYIKYVGRHDDIRPYFLVSDIFVFPSYREGFPNVVMQAGAMGLSCIVTDINGCNEIIVDRLNGLIIPPKDTEALFKSMQLLMDNYELRSFLSANARKMIADRFDQQDFWAALLEEYNTLIIEKLGNR